MDVRIIGVTGTRRGMTAAQVSAAQDILRDLSTEVEEMHHGDCIGADEQFVAIVRSILPSTKVVCRPCEHPSRAFTQADETMPTKKPLDRNRDIVNAADLMFGFPGAMKEELRSGTWATIRYARK